MDSPRGPGPLRILSAAAMLAAIFFLSYLVVRPLAPKPSGAPRSQFSAIRAQDILQQILEDDEPHPLGSAANEAVRTRLVDELGHLAYKPQVQVGFACSEYGDCATVNNVVARLDGSEPGDAVLLAAHYDSVPAAPGHSDDGAGVAAVLEIARALRSLPQPRHSIILLVDDGEEAGLLGARAFVNSHPWAKEVRTAVNLDARGTAGPALMFETGGKSEWAVHLFAQNAVQPATSSIFQVVYHFLSNSTDFSIFNQAGYEGLNFAFIGEETHYHTPLDDFANLNLTTLQHLGENALAAVVAAANTQVPQAAGQPGVYFDLLGQHVIYWSAGGGHALALAVSILLLAQIGWLIQTKRLAFSEFFWGLVAWLVTITVAGALAVIAARLLRFADAMPVNWVAHPSPLQIAFWSLGVAAVVANSAFFETRAQFWGLWSGVWLWLTLSAILTSWLAPGLSYLFLLPVFVAAIVSLPFTLRPGGGTVELSLVALLPLATAAILAYRPLVLLYDALGNRSLPLSTLFVALLLTPVAPLCTGLRALSGPRSLLCLSIPVVIVALAGFAAVVVPPYSAKAPEHVNMEYWEQTDSGASQWVVQPDSGVLPEPIRLAARFQRASHGTIPWDARPAFVASAPRLDFAPPTFTVLEASKANGRRSYRALLRSERGAPWAAAAFPPSASVESVSMDGRPMPPEISPVRNFYHGWTVYSCPAMPAGGIEIRFSVPLGKPVEISASDQSYGLPPEGRFLLNSRPLTATPSQNGDVTIINRRVQLLP
ncbi:MAG TPA: M20/M25/M40 family metallo-hydrolase [Candidatus Acidoferrales bacterium]